MTWAPPIPGEKTATWPKAPPGPRGTRRAVAGFTEVKQAAAQDMADDAGLRKMPSAMEGPMMKGPPMMPPESILPIGGVKGGRHRGGGVMRGKKY